MKMIFDVESKPKFSQMIVFAIQQLLAIMAATIAVPAIVGNGMTASAALFGAGVGTIVYQLFTKFKSPVFLGSSFAFIGSMVTAFAGAVSAALGFAGIILGAIFAGLVYVVIAIVIKLVGVNWINKLMPPVVIGPTVALIGLSLAGAAINDVFSYGPVDGNGAFIMTGNIWASLVCALVTFFNKQLIEDNNHEDMYKLVREKKWTFDKMMEMADKAKRDVNGDDTFTRDEDVFGVTTVYDYAGFLPNAFDYTYFTRDESNTVVLTGVTDKLIDINEKMYKFSHTDYCFSGTSSFFGGNRTARAKQEWLRSSTDS